MLFSDCFGVHWSHFVWSLGQVINVSKAWRVLELCPYLPSSKFLWPVNSGYLRVPFPWPAACERFLSSRLVSVPCSSWVMSFGFENGIPLLQRLGGRSMWILDSWIVHCGSWQLCASCFGNRYKAAGHEGKGTESAYSSAETTCHVIHAFPWKL